LKKLCIAQKIRKIVHKNLKKLCIAQKIRKIVHKNLEKLGIAQKKMNGLNFVCLLFKKKMSCDTLLSYTGMGPKFSGCSSPAPIQVYYNTNIGRKIQFGSALSQLLSKATPSLSIFENRPELVRLL
jgi:hypothetical protein